MISCLAAWKRIERKLGEQHGLGTNAGQVNNSGGVLQQTGIRVYTLESWMCVWACVSVWFGGRWIKTNVTLKQGRKIECGIGELQNPTRPTQTSPPQTCVYSNFFKFNSLFRVLSDPNKNCCSVWSPDGRNSSYFTFIQFQIAVLCWAFAFFSLLTSSSSPSAPVCVRVLSAESQQ